MKPLGLLSILPLLLLAACGDSSSENRGNDSTATSQAADTTAPIAMSASLPDSVWIKKGIPDPINPWTKDDMAKALETIQKENAGTPETLPHYDSSDADGVFARIISTENFAFFGDKAIPLEDRVNRGTEMVQSYAQIYFLYANAAMSGKPYTNELSEMMGTLLRLEAEFGKVINEFIKSVPPERRNSEIFQSGMQKMQGGIVQSFGGAITVLRDKETFTQAQLEKLARTFREVAPGLLSYLGAEQKQTLLQETQKTLEETDNPVIQNALIETFQIRQEKVSE